METKEEFKIWTIPDQKLPQILWKKGEEKAEAEKIWLDYELNRQIYLAQLTENKIATSNSQTEAERKARISQEYRDFCKEMTEAKKNVVTARSKVQAIQAEIEIRKKRSYDHSREDKLAESHT